MNKKKYKTQLTLIIINSFAIYSGYLILLAFALILHNQGLSSNILLTLIVIAFTSFFSFKKGLHPISAIISVYLFHWINLLTLNSHYALIQFIDSQTLGLVAVFLEPWLHLITASITSTTTYRIYLKNKPPDRKRITYE